MNVPRYVRTAVALEAAVLVPLACGGGKAQSSDPAAEVSIKSCHRGATRSWGTSSWTPTWWWSITTRS
jgi:hypothetical protein